MIDRPTNLQDRIGGKIQIEHYQGKSYELDDWNITKVLDNILMIQYADINESGTEIRRGSLWIPINAVEHTWRVGKVILAGPDCKIVKEGDHVVFPNDRGLKVNSINGLSNVAFLNEDRIFGVCDYKPIE